ncbi:MAG: site-2 protease family protein [Pseudomonadota bacterium]
MAALEHGDGGEAPLPRLKPELTFRLRQTDHSIVLVEDPISGTFFETDRETAALAQALDGQTLPDDALAHLIKSGVVHSIAPEMLPSVLTELSRNAMLAEGATEPAISTPRKRLGVIAQRIRLGRGDRFFQSMSRSFGWIHRAPGALIWLALVIAGGAKLIENWDRFVNELGALFSLNSLVYFWLAWLVTKAWHEFQHGIVTRNYGVEVREVGVLFILFLPLGAYVDASGVWRIDSRWRRLHVTAAGVLGEFALAAVAILLWSSLQPGPLASFLQSIIVAATISSLIFNMNPLMRFDGYFAIVDLFDVRNLYQRGIRAVRGSLFRIFASQSGGMEEPASILGYGWMALLWRYVVAGSLILLASHLAFGFGLLLAAAVIWALILMPAGRFLAAFAQLGRDAQWRGAIRLTLLTSLAVAALFVPLPDRVKAPGIVEFADQTEQRTTSAGQIVEIAVREDQPTSAGQLVMRLQNPMLVADAARLQADVAQQRTRLAAADAAKNPVERRRVSAELKTSLEELEETEVRLAGLELRSTGEGVILTDDIASMVSLWLERGDVAFEIGDPNRHEIQAWLTREDAQWISDSSGAVTFLPDIYGAPEIAMEIIRIDPRASRTLPPAAVTAEGGGPLEIVTDGEDQRLLIPRFKVALKPLETSDFLYAGVPGTLISDPDWRTGWSYVSNWIGGLEITNPADWASPQ